MTAPVLLVFFSPHPVARERAARPGRRDGVRGVRGPLPHRAGRHRRLPADRPGDADPVGPAGGRRHRRPPDAAAPGRGARSRSCARPSTRWSSSSPRRASPGGTSRGPPQPATGGDDEAEPAVDPRYAAAQAALEADDIDTAVAEYQKLVDANPADAEAAAGLGDGQAAAAHPWRRPPAGPRGRGREPRRRRRPDHGGRPRPARRPRRGRVRPAGRAGPAYLRRRPRRRPASTCWRCSGPSATTTRACCAAGRPSPRRSSSGCAAWPARSARPRASPPAPGTASTTRSRARRRRRSGSTAGHPRAPRRHPP